MSSPGDFAVNVDQGELYCAPNGPSFPPVMDPRPILLVTQYDGGRFSGWQRQPTARTIQGEMERVVGRLCNQPVAVIGAGRTDAGVHAHGQGAGVRVPTTWTAARLRHAVNALLPDDIWVAQARRMVVDFHPRRSATARRYRYLLGTDEAARSPFRRRFEWAIQHPLDGEAMHAEAALLYGEHTFRAFAVAHTAPIDDHHRCIVRTATWRKSDGGWVFEIEANRFLHHMVRFLVGTMVDVGLGRRPRGTIARLLEASTNSETSTPAPAHGLSLYQVTYPDTFYEIEL